MIFLLNLNFLKTILINNIVHAKLELLQIIKLLLIKKD